LAHAGWVSVENRRENQGALLASIASARLTHRPHRSHRQNLPFNAGDSSGVAIYDRLARVIAEINTAKQPTLFQPRPTNANKTDPMRSFDANSCVCDSATLAQENGAMLWFQSSHSHCLRLSRNLVIPGGRMIPF
jgi:hypothetical protein